MKPQACESAAPIWARLAVVATAGLASVAHGDVQPIGRWNAWLDSPGGRLPFELVVESADNGMGARIDAGEEIRIPRVEWSDAGLRLESTHYDSRICATWDRDLHPTMSFNEYAAKGDVGFLAKPSEGRWSVLFSKTDHTAIADLPPTR